VRDQPTLLSHSDARVTRKGRRLGRLVEFLGLSSRQFCYAETDPLDRRLVERAQARVCLSPRSLAHEGALGRLVRLVGLPRLLCYAETDRPEWGWQRERHGNEIKTDGLGL